MSHSIPHLVRCPQRGTLSAQGGSLRPNGTFRIQSGDHTVTARLALWGRHAFVVVHGAKGDGLSHHKFADRRKGDRTKWHPLEELLFSPSELHRQIIPLGDRGSISSTHVLVPTARQAMQIGFCTEGSCAPFGCEEQRVYFAPGDYEPTVLEEVPRDGGGTKLAVTKGHIRSGGELTVKSGDSEIHLWLVLYGQRAILSVISEGSRGIEELLAPRVPEMYRWTALQQIMWDPGMLLSVLVDGLIDATSVEVTIVPPGAKDSKRLGVYPNGRTDHKNRVFEGFMRRSAS